ncbi:hypothetical protein KKC1_19520 [Calderihabitans maritimus]|uniref:Uncharacterized protein n=1 Tax=Calderihabitans maritimus TaxID=1246530 RepID=A0A1Z5HTD7_9FIRM|nr:hypothetical protein KKC1_19520 [Calderihabitans maritimus]
MKCRIRVPKGLKNAFNGKFVAPLIGALIFGNSLASNLRIHNET